MKKGRIVNILATTVVLGSGLIASTVALADKKTESSSIEVKKDATGGSILSNMPGEVWATSEEAEKQRTFLENHQPEDINSKDTTRKSEFSDKTNAMVGIQATRYDIENNPILIGHWNPGDCSSTSTATYARHTIGDKSNTPDGDYLTTYGDVSHWNSNGWNALPYRNGSSEYPSQQVADVKMGVNFSVRDLGTNKATTIERTDFGPNQCPGSVYTKRIADIDKNVFVSLHNTTGIFYGRTWVPLVNYNP